MRAVSEVFVLPVPLGAWSLVTSIVVSVQSSIEDDSSQGTNMGTRGGKNTLKVGISHLGNCSKKAESTTTGTQEERAAHKRFWVWFHND